jgi:methionine-rich copper-binding protein CopC
VTAWRVALAAVVIALAAPAYAAAHAGFVASTPANDAVVEVAPKQVVLRFNQAVKVSSVRVFDGVGRPVPVGKVVQPQPSELVAPIEATLERDSYTVAWRVISDDVDPVSGFLVFHVGARRAPAAGVAAEPPTDEGSFPTPVLLLLICAGAVVTVALARLLGRVAGLAGAVGATSLVVIVALTAGTDAGETAVAKPFRANIKLGTLDSRLAIVPARVGWNRIELELPQPTGSEGGYFEVRVWASLKSAGLGPMHFAGIQGTELNSFAVRRAYLPLPGSWRLRVSARRGVSGRYATTLTVPVPAR